MKKREVREMEVEVVCCNICGKDITNDPFNKKRIEVVKGLFKTTDFDVHESCINKVLKEAFAKYVNLPPK